jgi:hypothetical protein
MLPTSQHVTATSASQILHGAIITFPSSPLTSKLAARLQFACLLFAAFFHGPPNHSNTSPKAISRGLGSQSNTSTSTTDTGSFFVPADGAPPPSSTGNVDLAEGEDDEPPSSLLQLLTEHLSLSLLARSKVGDDILEARSWDKVIVAYLVLLATWLWEDPKSVRIFLEGGGIGVVCSSILLQDLLLITWPEAG